MVHHQLQRIIIFKSTNQYLKLFKYSFLISHLPVQHTTRNVELYRMDNETDTDSSNLVHPLPPALLTTYLTIHSAGVLMNLWHLTIIARIQYRNSHGQFHKAFLYSIAVSDVILSGVRLLCTPEASQQLLVRYRPLCILSASIHNIFGVWELSVLMLGTLDRLMAVSSSLDYHNRFYVKHFTGVLLSSFAMMVMFQGALTVAFYEKAFSLGGVGVCKVSSDTLPYLEPGMFLGYPVFLTATFILYIILYKTKRMPIIGPHNRQLQVNLNMMTALLIALKWFGYFPMIPMLAMRAIQRPFPAHISWVMLSLNPVLNPTVYGISLTQYRRTVIEQCCLLCGTRRGPLSGQNSRPETSTSTSMTKPSTVPR